MLQDRSPAVASQLGGDAEASGDTARGQDGLLKPRESDSLSETSAAPSPFQKNITEINPAVAPTTPIPFGKCCENNDSLKCSHTVKPLPSSPADVEAGGRNALLKAPRTMLPSQNSGVDRPSGPLTTVSPGKAKAPNGDTAEKFSRSKSHQTPVGLKELIKDIYGRWVFT